jgi:hypothetical protein
MYTNSDRQEHYISSTNIIGDYSFEGCMRVSEGKFEYG